MADSGKSGTGGVGAAAAGLLSLVAVGLVLARFMHDAGWRGAPPHDATVRAIVLAGAAVAALTGAAQALAVLAADRRLRPASWVTRLALAGGLAGAALWLGAGVGALAGELGSGDAARTGALLAELAPVGAGVWALGAVAAAWRLRVWPAWLRVTGAVFGAAAMVQPGLPPLALVSLLAGLVWWSGLAAVLLRPIRDVQGSTRG